MSSWSREHRRAVALARKAARSIYGDELETRIQALPQSVNSVRVHVKSQQPGYADLLVKVMRPGFGQGHLGPNVITLPSVSMELQNRFGAESPDWLRIPRALLAEDSRGVIVMEYVPGE